MDIRNVRHEESGNGYFQTKTKTETVEGWRTDPNNNLPPPYPDKKVAVKTSYNGCTPQLNCVITSIVLAVLAGVVAYFCLTSGFDRLDNAFTSLERFAGGSLVYMGVVFSIVTVVNVALAGGVALFGIKDKNYNPENQKIHIVASVFGPVLAIPLAFIYGRNP